MARYALQMRLAVIGLTLLAACADTGCPQSISSYCADHGGCAESPPLTWQAAQDPVNWGSPAPPCAQTCGQVLLESCAKSSTAIMHGVDDGTDYVYDESGMLERITNYVMARRTCVAGDITDPGPPLAAAPGCTSQTVDLCCP